MGSSPPLTPTFQGHIASTQDALILFEACLSGVLNHVARRPHDRERGSLIKSGNVFIYEEHSSGIKRWTDGVPWSPSRILGNFLVYRELERPFPPGEKKRAMKRNKRSPGISKAQDPYDRSSSTSGTSYNATAVTSSYGTQNSTSSISKETERSLIGSLVDSYGFKDEGLVKKTVSVTVGGVSHHLVSYYSVADVMEGRLPNPSKDPRFQHIVPRQDLVTKQNFRTPIDEIDNMDSNDPSAYNNYTAYSRSGYGLTNQSISHRPMPLPTPPMSSYPSASAGLYSNYGMPPNSASYHDNLPATASSYGSQFTTGPGLYTTPKTEPYEHGFRPHRYNSVIGIGSDSSRAPMPAVSPNFPRRSSSAFEHGGSIDSSLSGISSASIDSKMSADSGYVTQGAYYGTSIRDASGAPQSYTPQRSLPTPTQQTYDRPGQGYPAHLEASGAKDSMWSLGGNAAASHAGHYIQPHQQPWTSTGTS